MTENSWVVMAAERCDSDSEINLDLYKYPIPRKGLGQSQKDDLQLYSNCVQTLVRSILPILKKHTISIKIWGTNHRFDSHDSIIAYKF